MSKKNFYITTTLPYINSAPHIGFAAEIIKADVIARYHRQLGENVIFNTGTDEHGLKIYQQAQQQGLAVQDYCDIYSAKFTPLKESLDLSYDRFIRTTDIKHQEAAQAFWLRCLANGDIYKKNYQVKYCVGCEMEKTDSELEDGRCPLHINQDLELIAEENYFFKFSRYQEKLLNLYDSKVDFVLPASRLKEIKTFVASGLQDFSISRQRDKMPHGVPVPNDDNQVMYVWFDALVNYISTLGWPNVAGEEHNSEFSTYWPGLQVCGKDNLRPQAAMWQAMLMSAGLSNSQQVLVFGFLTVDGIKMSKSLGNVIDPYVLSSTYGSDAVRYYLLAEMATFEDGDYSETKFKLRYNSDLANGLGNLAARLSNLLEKNEIKTNLEFKFDDPDWKKMFSQFSAAMVSYRFNEALHLIWEELRLIDEILSQKTPWKLSNKEEIASILIPLTQKLLNLSYSLEPLLPKVAIILQTELKAQQIKKIQPLFKRLD